MSIASINPHLPSLASPHQMVSNARGLAVTGLALYALSLLPTAYAFSCKEKEEICVKSCLGGVDGRETGACLIGCRLAYWACKWFIEK